MSADAVDVPQLEDPILTPEQVASLLRVTRSFVVRRLTRKGLRSIRMGKAHRFFLSDVRAFAEEHRIDLNPRSSAAKRPTTKKPRGRAK